MMAPTLVRVEGCARRLRRPGRHRRPRPRHPAGADHRDRRANACGKSTLLRTLARLLHAEPAGCTSTAARSTTCRPARSPSGSGILPQSPGGAGGHDGGGPRRPRPLPAPELVAAVVHTDEGAVHAALAATEHDRPRRPPGGRAVRRPAPARVDRDGGRAGAPRCCCSTSRRRTSTWRTRSTCSTWWSTSTAREGRTVVMVLHDLNQACRYADHVIAMKAGRIVASGEPVEVITAELVDRGLRRALPGDPGPGQRDADGDPDQPPPPGAGAAYSAVDVPEAPDHPTGAAVFVRSKSPPDPSVSCWRRR